MNMWYQSLDTLQAAIRAAGGRENLTSEELFSVALTEAILSASQELSLIQDQGVNPEWSQRSD